MAFTSTSKKSETIELAMSVDDALKSIVSMGVVAPKKAAVAATYPGD